MDKLDTQVGQIEVEAPSKSGAKSVTVKMSNYEKLAKARATKAEKREEKLKAEPAKKPVYAKTALLKDKIEKLDRLDELEAIIEKLDIIENRMGLKEPIKVKEEIVTEKEPEEIKPPEEKTAEENLKNKDPLKPDDKIKVEDVKAPPPSHKVFEGYNVRKYTSLRNIPIIKSKKY